MDEFTWGTVITRIRKIPGAYKLSTDNWGAIYNLYLNHRRSFPSQSFSYVPTVQEWDIFLEKSEIIIQGLRRKTIMHLQGELF
jgi:hypothetical protein